MAQVVPAGSDVSAGTYRCTNCSYELSVRSVQSLPPCPSCSKGEWRAVSGGDSAKDPYPGGRQSRRQSRTSRSSSGSSSRRSTRRGSGDERTKEDLYREARRLGIEGRSKMNKQQLAQAIGRRQGGRGAGKSAEKAHPVSVQAFLEGVNYPTRKGDLLREAKSQRASEEVRVTIERLPDRRFADPTEVSEAIGYLR